MNDFVAHQLRVPGVARPARTRLASIELLRYGRFADCTLALPPGGLDLHVVTGANEAGKTTLRSAISDLLYGFAHVTSYDFRYPGRELRIGATADCDGTALGFRRRKARMQSLLDLEDRPLPDAALQPFVGATDRDFFERMFSLDHPGLVTGGRELLEAKDDLGRLLFQSAAGIEGFGADLAALEEEREALWSLRRSEKRAYYQAEARLKEAQRTLKETVLRVGAWQAASRELERAREERAGVVKEIAAIAAEERRLQRLQRVLPKLAALKQALEEQSAMTTVPLLPADAASQLQAALRDIARAETREADAGTRIETLRKECERIEVDPALLARLADVRRLDEMRSQVAAMPGDIEKQRSQLELLLRNAADLARQLGWSEADETKLATRLPRQLVRTGLRDLAQRHEGLTGKLEEIQASIQRSGEAIADDRRDLAALPETPPDAGLAAALEAAERLGDTNRARAALARKLRAAEKQVSDAMRQLRPWTGTADELRALATPSMAMLGELKTRQQTLADERRTAERNLREQQRGLEQLAAQQKQIVRDENPVGADQLAAIRSERDSGWRRIRSSIETGSPREAVGQVGQFEGAMTAADTLADRRFGSAEASATLTQLRQQIERCERDLGHTRADLERFAREQTASDAELDAICRSLGLTTQGPSEIETWLRNRAAVLGLADAIEACRSEITELDRDCATLAVGLSGMLPEPHEAAAAETLPQLVAAARRLKEAQQRAWDQRNEATKRLHKSERALAALQARADEAGRALSAWEAQWSSALAEASLASTLRVPQVTAALDLMQKIDEALREARLIRETRIVSMQRDLDRFTAESASLVAEVAADLADQEPMAAAQALRRRCDDMQRAADRAAELQKQIAGLESHARTAGEQKRDCLARLQPLLEAAGATDIEMLPDAIERSDRRRTVASRIATLTQEILEVGDGLGLDAIAAEASDTDADTIPARLPELEQQRHDLDERREAAVRAITEAENALKRMQGQDNALQAEEQRQLALATMANVAERWVKLTVSVRLLRAAIDLYRERQQDPLLARAREIFATLTLGEFASLRVEADEDQLALVGIRRDGEKVPVEGLSTGTRDQLFLALRIAAVEQYLDVAPALPFIADDLFINFDDQRAAAGFQVLQRLTEKTQVLFFTHHQHLAEIAHAATGGQAKIVSL